MFGGATLSTRALSRVARSAVATLHARNGDRKPVSVGPLRLLVLALFFYSVSFFGLSLATRQLLAAGGRHADGRGAVLVAVASAGSGGGAEPARAWNARIDRPTRRWCGWSTGCLKAAIADRGGALFLYLADVDLTAALTGLGVGGIAIGFGAQKTIENLFGGIMVISDKPINVGDVCKAGEFIGTVEDIGIRSTRIRTLNRTVVSVPNGLLSSMSLENFAQRDRILFQHTVALGRQTTADQMRVVLEQIRGLLDAHPRVDAASARARFIRFSTGSLDLEIFAYVLEQPAAGVPGHSGRPPARHHGHPRRPPAPPSSPLLFPWSRAAGEG